VQEGPLARGNDRRHDMAHQASGIAAPAKIGVGADGAYLTEAGRAHAFARHCHQSAIDPDTDEAAQAVGVGDVRAGPGEAGQREHLGRIGVAQHDVLERFGR
jgi:hypothetical protein